MLFRSLRQTAQRSVGADGLDGILGACGVESARRPQQGRQRFLVEAYERYEDCFSHVCDPTAFMISSARS